MTAVNPRQRPWALRRPRAEGTSSEADPDTPCTGESTSLSQRVPRRLDVATTITQEMDTERDPQKLP